MPDAPATDYLLSGLLGIELEVRAGVMLPDSVSPVLAPGFYPTLGGDPTGDILEGKEKPYVLDPFALSIAGGYRFLPLLSAGVFFDYANYQVNDGTDTGDYNDSGGGTTAWLERQMWQLGAYVRYYLTTLHPRLQPWVELGVGYSQDTASYTPAGTQQEAGRPPAVKYYLCSKASSPRATRSRRAPGAVLLRRPRARLRARVLGERMRRRRAADRPPVSHEPRAREEHVRRPRPGQPVRRGVLRHLRQSDALRSPLR